MPAEIETRRVKFRSLPGRLKVEGPYGPISTIEFDAPKTPKINVPQVESERRNFTKDEIRNLNIYERVSGRELSLRVGIDWTSQFEEPTGDTRSSERSYAFNSEEAKRDDDFRTATENLLKRGMRPWMLQDSIRRAGLRMGDGKTIGQVDETVLFQVEELQEEVALIEKELIEGPQR